MKNKDIVKFKGKKNSYDVALSLFHVINYIKDREGHYYPKGNLSKYTMKFDRIKNTSSDEVFMDFKKWTLWKKLKS